MNLPEGFKLDEPKASLPEGFKLEEQKPNIPEGFKLEAAPVQEEAKTSNPFKGLVARAASLAGEGVEAVARVAENLGDKLETAMPLTNLTPEQIKNENQLQPMFEWANALRSYGKDIGYTPATQLKDIPGKPLLLVPFIAERVISSSPDMIAAAYASPAYITSLTNEILNERLANDNKSLEDATVADVTASVGTAVLQTVTERLATKHLFAGKLGAEAATGIGRVGKELGIQAGTEAFEEGVDYLGRTVGTKKTVDIADLAQNMLEGAIVGGGMGAGVQGGKEYATKKERAKLEETLGPDLESKLGRKPTDAELGGFVDTFLHERKRAEEAATATKPEEDKAYQTGLGLAKRLRGENNGRDTTTGIDTGTTNTSVPLSEQQEANKPTQGAATSTAGGMGGDTGLAGTSVVGKGSQQTALTPEQIKDISSPESQQVQNNTGTMAHTLFNPNNVRKDGRPGWDSPPQERWSLINAFEMGGRDARSGFSKGTEGYTDTKEKQAYELGLKYANSLIAGSPIDVSNEATELVKQETAPTETDAATAEEGDVETVDKAEDKKDSPIDQATISSATNEEHPMTMPQWLASKGLSTDDLSTMPEEDYHALREEQKQYFSQFPGFETKATAEANPVVDEFDALTAQRDMAIDQGDTAGARELLQKMSTLRKDLPEDHPQHIKPEGKKTIVLTKAERKAKAKQAEGPKLAESPRIDEIPKHDKMGKPVHPTVFSAIKNNDLTAALKALKNTGGQFLSNLADHLLKLNLNTRIGLDLQFKLVDIYMQKTEQQRVRVLTFLQIFHPEVYNDHFDRRKMHSPMLQMSQSFYKLKTGKINIDMRGFEEDLHDINESFSSGIKALAAPGMYYKGTASFNTESGLPTNHTFVHEISHAASHWAISNEHLLDTNQKKALANLKELFAYAKANAKDQGAYGFNDLHEFVAEAFSNPRFQRELRDMKRAMDSNQSGWSKFIQFVYGMIGGDNVLFHTMANADVLFSAKVNGSNLDRPIFAPDKYSIGPNGKFQVNTNERSGPMAFIKALIAGKVKWNDMNKKNLSKFLDSTNAEYRRYLLGGLTLDQLTDIVGADLPQFKLYVREVDAMIHTRNQILAEGEVPIKDWSQLLETNPEKATQLGNMMIEATLKKIDPDSQGTGHDAAAFHADKDLKDAWAKMVAGPDGTKALKIYREVRKFYERRANEYVNIQLDRLRDREEARGTDKAKIDALIQQEHTAITKEMIRPYFPIKRFGDYWLQVGKGKSKIFMQFEDAWSRDKELDNQKQKLVDSGMTEEMANNSLDSGQGFSEGFGQRLADVQHLQKLKERVDIETDNILASTDPAVKADEVNSLRDALKDGFDQYYMETLPAQSIQKMFLHRDNIAGPSADMLRAFAVSRQRVAYQRARFQHMPNLFNTIEGARSFLKTVPFEERGRLRDYVNELELNLKNAILEPPKQSALTTGLTQFGFLHFLTSPASAIVNMMAIPGIYIPNAAAKYGIGKTTKVLAKYNRLLGGTGFRSDKTGKVEFLSLSRANLEDQAVEGGPMVADEDGVLRPATLADVYNEGVARGVIDTTLTHEAAAIGEQPSNQYTGRWQKFMYYASLPFHSAEKYNRETAFMSSFELAYDKYTEKGFTAQKAYDAALQDARDLTQKTMFNYNTINKPRYFRGDIRNVLLQFKMYPQHMSVLMYRTFHQALGIGQKLEMEHFMRSIDSASQSDKDLAIKEKQAELDDIRKESIKAFTGMMGFTFASAGITGLPLFFVFQGVASAFHAAFGDDDEPFDSENWFKNWCNRTFGGFAGDVMSRGILSKATGVNFADRMGVNLTDMWFPDVKKSQDEVQYMQNMMTNLMGPTAGALLNYVEAAKRYREGYTERAIETMMPSAIKNVMVGTRYMVEGKALTMKGATLDENINPAEALAQMLGFSPEDTAQKQKSAFEMKNSNEIIVAHHNDLLNAFFIAVDGSDPEMMQKVLEKIQKFNKTNPGVAIDGDALYNSIQRKYQDRALANITGGMPINKKLLGQLNGMRDYAQ